MTEWFSDNSKWLFNGTGGVIAAALLGVIFRRKKRQSNTEQTSNQHVTVNVNTGGQAEPSAKTDQHAAGLKEKTSILFVDDDGRFKVVSILKRSGWLHTRRIADVHNLDSIEVMNSHILFIDIQGVGKKLLFTDEGLGLAEALKNKYPEKKIVIYSVQDEGKRFHNALRKADDFISKNADPYEFQELTERLAEEYWAASE